jgi:hypothetical protein
MRGGSLIREVLMLDIPEKAALTALKVIVPFEVELLPAVIKHLQSENRTIATLSGNWTPRLLLRPICREVDGQLALRDSISTEKPA